MAAKTQLKDRVTGEELYPVITKDCIPGTEIITTDNVPVIPNDENYGPGFSGQNVIEVAKFAEGFEKANKVGFGFDIIVDTCAYISDPAPDDDYGCPIMEEKPNEFIHNYHIPVTDNMTDYTGAVNLTTARYVQKLINNIPNATTDKEGVMSTLDKKALDNLAAIYSEDKSAGVPVSTFSCTHGTDKVELTGRTATIMKNTKEYSERSGLTIATISAATSSNAGVMSATDKKLISSLPATITQVGAVTHNTSNVTLATTNYTTSNGLYVSNSSTKTINNATTSRAGVMSAADKTTLNYLDSVLTASLINDFSEPTTTADKVTINFERVSNSGYSTGAVDLPVAKGYAAGIMSAELCTMLLQSHAAFPSNEGNNLDFDLVSDISTLALNGTETKTTFIWDYGTYKGAGIYYARIKSGDNITEIPCEITEIIIASGTAQSRIFESKLFTGLQGATKYKFSGNVYINQSKSDHDEVTINLTCTRIV